MKIVCAKRRAALRCRHIPPRGGFRETTNTNSRTFPLLGLLRAPRARAADWQVRSYSGGVGGGPRLDGDQRGNGSGAEAGASREVRGGDRQGKRQRQPGRRALWWRLQPPRE